jgi:predicted helicase
MKIVMCALSDTLIQRMNVKSGITNKESGITNNPNDRAKDVGNPRYIQDLLLSVITVRW